jgi:hypothetical protein
VPWSVVAAAPSGAIGAACEDPAAAANNKPATAIANIVRFIDVLLGQSLFAERTTRQHDGGSATVK